MRVAIKKAFLYGASLSVLLIAVKVSADFINGGFETGDFTGWTKSIYTNSGVTVAATPENTPRADLGIGSGSVDSGGGTNVSADASTGALLDANTNNNLKFPYFGRRSALVNVDSTPSTTEARGIRQSMVVTTADVDSSDNKPHVRFVVAPVVQNPSGHSASQQPYYFVQVRNVTKSTVLFSTFKYANQPGVPWITGASGYLYTNWQLVDVNPTAGQLDIGDTVEVEVIASRCSLGGHNGYVYVDGIGSFLPGLSVVASGPAQANTGSTMTYVYNYRNGNALAVNNATVRIALPTGTTFASLNAPGASCSNPTPGSGGTVSCNVGSLPTNATGSFRVTVNVTGSNGSTVGHGDYDIDSDSTDPLLGPLLNTSVTSGVTYADLEASITDGVAAVGWGSTTQYSLVVSNNGPSATTGATVAYAIPTNIASISWTCSGTGGASCGASGTGAISDSVNIPSGGSVIYTINAVVNAGTGSSSIVSSATVSGGSATDNVPGSNTAVDNNQVGTLITVTTTKSVAIGGTVTSVPAAINCGTSCSSDSADFLENASLTLSAVAATNFEFIGWTGAGCSGTAPCSFTLTTPETVDAEFDCAASYYGANCGSQCGGGGNCSSQGTCSDGTSGTGCSCNAGFIGSGCNIPDADGDGVDDGVDNCPGLSNSAQTDTDSDGDGDLCDADDDNDSIADGSDCSPLNNAQWRNQAYADVDNDGVRESTSLASVSCFGTTPPSGSTLNTNGPDNCPSVANPTQIDSDSDGQGDACDVVPAPVIRSVQRGGGTTPTVNGTARPGDNVQILVDGVVIGTTTADSNGDWTFTPTTGLSLGGARNFSARVLEAGNVQSPVSGSQPFNVTGTTVLDFDGDGLTDIATLAAERGKSVYRYTQTSDNVFKEVELPIGLPVPADYDGDGQWDEATAKRVSNGVEWNILLSSTNTQQSVVTGKKNDIIISGCRVLSAGKYSIMTMRGRTLYAREIGSSTDVVGSVKAIKNGDLLGCADTTGDGLDELIFRVPTANNRQHTVVTMNFSNSKTTYFTGAKFEGRLILRRYGNDPTMVVYSRAVGKNRSILAVQPLEGSYDFTPVSINGSFIASNGTFLNETNEVVQGILWQTKDNGHILRKMITPSTASNETISASSLPRRILLAPQNRHEVQ